MKSPDEIKKGLEYCSKVKGKCKDCPCYSDSECSIHLAADALTYIRQLEEHIRDLTKMIPKWISVNERLPEPFVSVLVHIPEEEPLPQVHEGYITPDGTWCSVLYVETYDRVAHWMSMPEMPEEGE